MKRFFFVMNSENENKWYYLAQKCKPIEKMTVLEKVKVIDEMVQSLGYVNWKEEDATEAFMVMENSHEFGVDAECLVIIPYDLTLSEYVMNYFGKDNVYCTKVTR